MNDASKHLRAYLIVEDDRFSRRSIRRHLDSFGGCEVFEAENGRQALDLFSDGSVSIDVIISDFSMPVLHGLELLKLIRSGETSVPHDTPFIMLTGKTDRLLAGLALSLDVDAFLTKPVSRRALELLLNRIGGQAGNRPTIQEPNVYKPVSLDAAMDPARES